MINIFECSFPTLTGQAFGLQHTQMYCFVTRGVWHTQTGVYWCQKFAYCIQCVFVLSQPALLHLAHPLSGNSSKHLRTGLQKGKKLSSFWMIPCNRSDSGIDEKKKDAVSHIHPWSLFWCLGNLSNVFDIHSCVVVAFCSISHGLSAGINLLSLTRNEKGPKFTHNFCFPVPHLFFLFFFALVGRWMRHRVQFEGGFQRDVLWKQDNGTAVPMALCTCTQTLQSHSVIWSVLSSSAAFTCIKVAYDPPRGEMAERLNSNDNRRLYHLTTRINLVGLTDGVCSCERFPHTSPWRGRSKSDWFHSLQWWQGASVWLLWEWQGHASAGPGRCSLYEGVTSGLSQKNIFQPNSRSKSKWRKTKASGDNAGQSLFVQKLVPARWPGYYVACIATHSRQK